MRSNLAPTLFAFLFSITANAALFPSNPTLTIGGRVYTDLSSSLIILYCQASANKYTTCRKQGVSSGYQVTSGKTLTISSVQLWSSNSTQGNWQINQTDTDIGLDSSSNGTNPVYKLEGASTHFWPAPSTAAGAMVINGDFTFAATKYVTVENGAGTTAVDTFILYGYEN